MSIEEIFKNYREKSCDIKNKNIEIENLTMDHKHSAEIVQTLRKEIKIMENENKKIDNVINLLPYKQQQVVRGLFINGKEKKDIADELERTERQINNYLKSALGFLSNRV